jgi:6-methylsalicylate decarboxylase
VSRIDVHAHYYPAEFAELTHQPGSAFGSAHGALGGSLEQRLQIMDEHGVDVQVLSVGSSQPYYAELAASAAREARITNDLYQQAVAQSGGRFAAFGCLPLPHLDASLAELDYCLGGLHMAGVNLGCSVNGLALDDARFEPLWAELNRHRAVVFLHPLALRTPLVDSFGLPFLVGTRFEDTITGVRLVLSGLTTRFPDVKIILSHLGGAIPFMWERILDGARRSPEKGIDALRELRRLYYDSVSNAPAAMLCSCQTVGAGHILYGSDFPYLASGTDFGESIEYIRRSGIPEEDVTAILDRNAQGLLA